MNEKLNEKLNEQLNKVKVVDAAMGKGKTSWAIQKMNSEKGPFIYITPFLSEVKRVLNSCKIRHFKEPEESRYRTKSDSLKSLIIQNENIASTHSLFKLVDEEAISLLKERNYTLILDETVEVIEQVKLKEKEIHALFEKGVLQLGLKDKNYCKVLPGEEKRLEKYAHYRDMAELERLVFIDDCILMWVFPVKAFLAFKNIYTLTYLFHGSILKAFFDFHEIPFELYGVEKKEQEYKLIPYHHDQDLDTKEQIKGLVDIYEGFLNNMGNHKTAFSKNWYSNLKPEKFKQIRNSLLNYFCNIQKSSTALNMWTVYKDFKSKLKGKGYSQGFVSCSIRATNDYKEKGCLSYMVNMFLNPYILKFFKIRGIDIDEELWALSEMLQWVYRSRIRENLPINVYIPAKRMRDLFKSWLSGTVFSEILVEPYE